MCLFFSSISAADGAAVVGTFIGKRLINKVSEENFKKYYFIVLNIAGLKILLFDGLWGVGQLLLK